MAYDGNKLTKVEALKALAERVNNDFITKAEAQKQIKQEVAQAGHAKFEKVETLPEVADAQENVMYLLYNEKTKHYDIYAKIGESIEQLDDTTVDLSGYVAKEEGKELITTEEKTKLAGIAEGAPSLSLLSLFLLSPQLLSFFLTGTHAAQVGSELLSQR